MRTGAGASSPTTHDADEDLRNRDIKIYVNGDIVHRGDAKVSVYDSGFMLGDGMWEGPRLYDGYWAFFDDHMDRFFNSCNFFIVRRGEVWTSTGDYCMNGVTRQKVIDLCRANDIPIYEKNFALYETYGADEALLTGTPASECCGNEVQK